MIKTKHLFIFTLLTGSLLTAACSYLPWQNATNTPVNLSNEWQPLLTNNLNDWEIWMGVPHSSVTGLPKGTLQADNLNVHGDPKDAMGLNNDIKNVFSIIEEDNQPVLSITGEIYGGISTKASFENYHLSFQVKWGDKKWAPRLTALRDSGLLFHCQGEHGAFWKVWKLCQEFQVQETDLGDYIPLGNHTGKLTGKIRSRKIPNSKRPVYDPNGALGNVGYASAFPEVDKPHGQWNTLELFAVGDRAVFVVNNTVVMVVEQLADIAGNPLNAGQLQFQSEGAELFYRDIKIKALPSMPKEYEQYFN